MTTIAWDGVTLAVDRQATSGDAAMLACKMRKDGNVVMAWCGSCENGVLLANWYLDGADPEKWPAFQRKEGWSRLIVKIKDAVFEYEQEPVSQLILDQKAAWGSGKAFALGAMEMGADAVRAVEIASKYDIYSGLGVTSSHGD